MAKNPPDERVIYLALKNIFKGIDAQLRDPKKISKFIQKHKHHRDIQELIQNYSIEHVCHVAKALLGQQIFESTLKAKIRFPEVFEVSRVQSAERAASEAKAAKTESDAIKDAAEGRRGASTPMEGNEKGMRQKGNERQTCSSQDVASPRKLFIPHSTMHIPSLYPVYLPLKTQHQLLVKVQAILERACYTFGQKTMTDILREAEWDCPEAAELNLWSRVFLSNQDKFPADELKELGKPLSELLDSMTELRHTAVHRIRVNVNKIEQFMVDSESLAKLLQNDACGRTLSQLRRETQSTIDELKRNKDLLESRLVETLKSIAAQKAELQRLERMAVEDMLREDKEYRALAGANLEQAVIATETTVQSAATTENETGSEPDVDADGFDEPDVGQTGEKHPGSTSRTSA